MHLARLSLGITAGALAGFGTWLLLRPQALSRVGVELPSPTARAEIGAFYGGLEIGLAASSRNSSEFGQYPPDS